jgi:hypothetical protein
MVVLYAWVVGWVSLRSTQPTFTWLYEIYIGDGFTLMVLVAIEGKIQQVFSLRCLFEGAMSL